MNMNGFGMNIWNMHGFMWIYWIIIIGLLVWLIFYLTNQHNKKEALESPLDILKKRYARGEISKKEFLDKKNAME